jgi:beta-N-acetylhexosaminidase
VTQPPEPDRAARRVRARQRRQESATRRRRLGLAAAALLAAAAGAVLGSRSGSDEEGTPAARASAAACPPELAASRRRLVGQMLIVRMEDEATPALLDAARHGEIGGVILFPSAGAQEAALRREIAALRAAAAAGGAPAPLVMIDQEGGDVKRLAEAPPDRAPAALARAGKAAARQEGLATARALAGLGVNVDLAPVLDLRGPDSFVADRAFASDPAEVARIGTAFAAGLDAGGVAAAVKHFPGLGLATANSDETASVVDASRAQLAPGLRPFAAAVEANVGLVMAANATYPAYDRARPATLSPRLIGGLLRRRLGYEGAVITDDLGAGALAGVGIDEGEAALGAAGAGADLLLFALSDGSAARAALLRGLERGSLKRAALLESCARTTALRERYGA